MCIRDSINAEYMGFNKSIKLFKYLIMKMNNFIFVSSFALLFGLCFMQNCQVQKDKIKEDLEHILQGKDFQKEIINIQWLHKAYEQFATQEQLKQLNICQKLKSVKLNELKILEKFFLYQLSHLAECKINLDEETKNFIENEQKSTKLDNFYKAFQLRAKYQPEKNISDLCQEVPNFLDKTGSGLGDSKKQDGTFKKSYLVYEMAVICLEQKNFQPTEQFTKTINTAIKGFLANSIELSSSMIGVFEKNANAFLVTAANVLQIYKLNKYLQNKEFVEIFDNYMNFIMEGKTIYLSPQEKAIIFQLTKIMHSHPKIKLENNVFELSGSQTIEIKGKITDYFGKELSNAKKLTIEANLQKSQKNKKLDVKMAQNSFVISILTNEIELGTYFIEFQINGHQQEVKEQVRVKFATNAKIQHLKFDTGYQNFIPESLKYKVNYGETLPTILPADQSSFIYLQFQIFTFVQIKPQLVSARLINSKYIKATNQVIAKYNEKTQIYSVIIDLGDPDHVRAYKGLHQLELIVADPLLSSNVQWKFAKFEIDFKRELTTRPIEDTDYLLKPEIQHYFALPQADPPRIITIGFVVLLTVFIIVFLVGVCKLNMNSEKLFKGFSVIMFTICIMGYLGVLVLFWVKINIFQTLFLFLVLAIPTLISGNFALLTLNQKEKEKVD
eukprot:TRINITY_DN1169_c0_g2_i1.p1 TRINITY_DN1169_c0_g2~~TRINITY_DN1169_c0_g2_i1.p1  ORF type:complete len:670 (+),score=100.12 TRINITY_DN1169_c0_g2_i1:77-2086(+)